MTVGPNPFSREGSQPGDGLGEANRFETLADGATPQTAGTTPSPAPFPAPGGSGGPPAGPRPSIAHPEPSGFIAADPYAPPPPSAQWATSAFPTYDRYAASGQALPPAPPYPVQPYPGQPYPGQPYPGQPYPGQAYGPTLLNSPYATVSLVTGILGVFCGITGPLAVGFGVAALRQISNEPRTYGGRGVAIAGLVTGILGSLWLMTYILAIFGS